MSEATATAQICHLVQSTDGRFWLFHPPTNAMREIPLPILHQLRAQYVMLYGHGQGGQSHGGVMGYWAGMVFALPPPPPVIHQGQGPNWVVNGQNPLPMSMWNAQCTFVGLGGSNNASMGMGMDMAQQMWEMQQRQMAIQPLQEIHQGPMAQLQDQGTEELPSDPSRSPPQNEDNYLLEEPVPSAKDENHQGDVAAVVNEKEGDDIHAGILSEIDGRRSSSLVNESFTSNAVVSRSLPEAPKTSLKGEAEAKLQDEETEKRQEEEGQLQGHGPGPVSSTALDVDEKETEVQNPQNKTKSGSIVRNCIKVKRTRKRFKLRINQDVLLSVAKAYLENEISKKQTDVMFICQDGKSVMVHKSILAFHSKLFTQMLVNEPLSEMAVISVPDVTSDIMKLIVHLCYMHEKLDIKEDERCVMEYLSMFGLDSSCISCSIVPADDNVMEQKQNLPVGVQTQGDKQQEQYEDQDENNEPHKKTLRILHQWENPQPSSKSESEKTGRHNQPRKKILTTASVIRSAATATTALPDTRHILKRFLDRSRNIMQN